MNTKTASLKEIKENNYSLSPKDYINKFTDAEFLSADEKQKILKNWIAFLKFLAKGGHLEHDKNDLGSDYGNSAPRVFTKRIYEHLHLHCGFIAHYDINGFYSEYFNGDYKDLERFFNSIETWGEYADIGEAMMKVFDEYKDKIFQKAEETTDNKFELLKECIKRAEDDKEFRKELLSKVYS